MFTLKSTKNVKVGDKLQYVKEIKPHNIRYGFSINRWLKNEVKLKDIVTVSFVDESGSTIFIENDKYEFYLHISQFIKVKENPNVNL